MENMHFQMNRQNTKRSGSFAFKIICLCFSFVLIFHCLTFAEQKEHTFHIMHETEFGGVYLDITIDDFNALGFTYGDGVTVQFSNGYCLNNIPYYNGYYTQNGEALVVAYPGYPYIKVGINNSADLWDVAGLTEDDTADVVIADKAGYLAIQNARDISYKDDRELFPSDEVFANFRDVTVGNIKPDRLFRSASPCDNQHNRAPYVDALLKENNICSIVNLAEDTEKIEKDIAQEDFNSPYFLELYQAGHVLPLAMNTNFASESFQNKVKEAMNFIADENAPFLVHCTEGKDRTGFVCMLLEALCGASYDEIVTDYMKTYENYYEITEEKDKEKYDVIVEDVLNPMIQVIVSESELENNERFDDLDLQKNAADYLLSIGVEKNKIEKVKAKLCE